MSEFNNLFNDEFFIIDSENLDAQKTKLFGYAIVKEGDKYKIIDEYLNNPSNLTPEGAYIYIYKKSDKIIIYQDFNRSYGLYLYKKGDYFCISNSFLKLVNYLKYNILLSLNETVAKSLLTTTLCTFSHKQTLSNEIEIIPRNRKVIINLKTRDMHLEKIYYDEGSIDLNSNKAFEILDNWFYKWVSIFRNLKLETDNITCDLTGGVDSRISFALLCSSNIDLNRINVHSTNDKLHSHAEDYKIATEIANCYNFKLNDKQYFDNYPQYFNELSTIINISFYIKLGFHNQMYFKNFRNLKTVYRITGAGGESVRNHVGPDVDFYINRAKNFSLDLIDSPKKIFDKNFEEYDEEYNINDDEFLIYNSRETRRTNHFGRGNVENYLSNTICLTPLIDSNLAKLKCSTNNCPDDDLLFILILVRYYPDLLKFRFDQEEKAFSSESIKYAENLNKKYNFIRKDLSFISEPVQKVDDMKIDSESKSVYNSPDVKKYLKNIFLSNSFKNNFQMYYSPKIYNKFALYLNNAKFMSLQFTYIAFAIMKMITDVEVSHYYNNSDELYWLEKYNEISPYNNINDPKSLLSLEKFIIGRIDVITKGDLSSIEILDCSDVSANMKSPKWLNKSGRKGVVIESNLTSIDISLKIKNTDLLKILIRSKDFKDKNKKRCPIYIDFTSFKINDKEMLKEKELVWHNEPFIYKKKIKDTEETIKIHAQWQPLNNNSILK